MALVSVCILVYNHELYIKEAIEGILKQQVNFEFELIISNDASTDNSHEEILMATQNLPNHIFLKYFNHQQNLGMIGNVEFSLKECKGKYMAICEGDDYWIDPLKLQRQIVFLDTHPKYNLVTGNVKEYIQNTNTFKEPKQKQDYTFTFSEMIVRNHCPTCATMIRNFIKEEPDFKLFPNRGSDSQIWLRALGKNGKGRYMAQTLAVYRRHDTSATGIRNAQKSSYEGSINFMKRKIDKAKFWNKFYQNHSNKPVLLVKYKMYRKMIQRGIEYDKYPQAFFSLLKFFWVKTKLIFYWH